MLSTAALLLSLCGAAAAAPSSPVLDQAAAALKAGDRKQALKLLAKSRKGPASNEQRETEALLYAELEDYAVARSLMEALVLKSPEDARLRLYLATIIARAGDRGSTLVALGEARRLKPNAEDRQRMAFLYQDFKDYEPARELLDELIAELPGNMSVRLDRVSLAAQSGDIQGGLAHLAAASALNPGHDERRRMATLARDLGDFTQARALLDGLIAESPGDGRLHFDRAFLTARSGDRAATLKALAEAREHAEEVGLRRRIAALYQELKEYGEARALLESVVASVPREAGARIELASLDALRGERDAALKSLAAARGLKPGLQERQRMALLYADLQEPRAARRMIDDLIAEVPQDPQLRLDRAYMAAYTGDRAGALAFLAETLAHAPDPDDRRRMATLYERLGAQAEARAAQEAFDQKSR